MLAGDLGQPVCVVVVAFWIALVTRARRVSAAFLKWWLSGPDGTGANLGWGRSAAAGGGLNTTLLDYVYELQLAPCQVLHLHLRLESSFDYY